MSAYYSNSVNFYSVDFSSSTIDLSITCKTN
nr:MAG TPA: Leucine-rich repeat [Caudoviricetes sp.]